MLLIRAVIKLIIIKFVTLRCSIRLEVRHVPFYFPSTTPTPICYNELVHMKRRFTEDSWRKEPWFRGLVSAFSSCRSEEELENFLRDIGTLSELQALSERFEVARLLANGLSYRQVSAKTGASTTTVTRVANFLENGEGGYRAVLKTHRHHELRKKQAKSGNREISKEPSNKAKKEIKNIIQTPLQKYLQK